MGINDNFDNDPLDYSNEAAAAPTQLYTETDYKELMREALAGLLEITDDSDLGYTDGRANMVHVQLMDSLAYTAHKQIDYHQRLLDQDVQNYTRFLKKDYVPNNELADRDDDKFQAQIARNQKAIAIYYVMKEQAVALYLDVSGKATWVPFTERGRDAPPSNKLAQAKLAALLKQHPPKQAEAAAA
jgi:hypothetical protein